MKYFGDNSHKCSHSKLKILKRHTTTLEQKLIRNLSASVTVNSDNTSFDQASCARNLLLYISLSTRTLQADPCNALPFGILFPVN